MSDKAPLLEKARKESIKKSFRLPHRGRIRFVLFFVIAGLGFWWYRNSVQPDKPSDEASAFMDSTVTEQKPSKQRRSLKKVKKEKSRKKPEIKLPGKLTFERIKDIFKQAPPRLTHTKDTIHFKKGANVVHLSVDTTLQRIGIEYLRRYHPKYGALVIIEPSTGRILSLVSYTDEGEEVLARNLFCSSLFPAASIFKIIAAAGAIEKAGLRADSKLKTRGRNHTLYNSQLKKELKEYREITLKEAFAYSINPVFGRIGIFTLGADGLNEYAVKFGFNANIPFELDNEKAVFIYPDSTFAIAEMACGFNQSTTMSPLFGAMIAAGISHHGKIYAPTIVDSITDLTSGENRYSRQSVLWRMPIQEETAEEMVALMKGVARYGTARKAFRYIKKSCRFKEIEYGGKTGSVDKEGMGKADWFVGFSRHKTDASQHLATGIVTVHGDYWTVHSSFIGAEMMRKHIRRIQIVQKEERENRLDSLAGHSNEIHHSPVLAKK